MQSPIRAILLLVFIAIPLLEIALLIKIGQAIGFWATILIVIATAAIGTWLLHKQGMETLRRVLSSMDDGKPPVQPVLEGFLLLVAGLLLLTPGILTDTAGFILLIPPVRELIVRYGLNRMFVVTVGGQSWRPGRGDGGGDFERGTDRGRTEQGAGSRRGPGADRQQQARPRGTSGGGGGGPIIEGEYERLDERTVDPRRDKD